MSDSEPYLLEIWTTKLKKRGKFSKRAFSYDTWRMQHDRNMTKKKLTPILTNSDRNKAKFQFLVIFLSIFCQLLINFRPIFDQISTIFDQFLPNFCLIFSQFLHKFRPTVLDRNMDKYNQNVSKKCPNFVQNLKLFQNRAYVRFQTLSTWNMSNSTWNAREIFKKGVFSDTWRMHYAALKEKFYFNFHSSNTDKLGPSLACKLSAST